MSLEVMFAFVVRMLCDPASISSRLHLLLVQRSRLGRRLADTTGGNQKDKTKLGLNQKDKTKWGVSNTGVNQKDKTKLGRNQKDKTKWGVSNTGVNQKDKTRLGRVQHRC